MLMFWVKFIYLILFILRGRRRRGIGKIEKPKQHGDTLVNTKDNKPVNKASSSAAASKDKVCLSIYYYCVYVITYILCMSINRAKLLWKATTVWCYTSEEELRP